MARVSVAWSNLLHERTRLLVAISGVAFAVILIFMNLGFMGALISTATNFYEQFNADLFIISTETLEISTSTAFPRERIYQVAGIDGVERIMPLYSEYLLWRNPETGVSRAIFSYGVNPNDPVFLMPELQGDEARRILSRPNTVFFDRLSRPEFGPQDIGTTTEADRRQATIGGTYTLGGGFAADGTLIMSDQNFVRYLKPRPLNLINMGLIQVNAAVSPEKVAETMDSLLPADVAVYTKPGMIDHDATYWLEATSIGFIFSMGVVVSFVVGAVIVYQILFTDIRDHLPEYATMKAMGYRSRYLFKIVLQEAILLAVLGYLPGLAAALGLYHLTAKATAGTLPVAMNGGRVIFVLGLTLLMCCLSGLISVRKAITADPAEIF
ncbi:ABC transporter permease DevC [Leptothoe kymatousa]|uniref:FtsX-like permease family protein n=1 Tax=Leptothoe kymatousa TAU-MAC 1615 TaxID=2364775 RepID=A0ABS5Y132_9CYAN|nr:ABC transporter permease DevC [Leptothoe kymatousa]MBT9311524.1 FtsX-like permease family protein [Leptothoe kymatousa TAU-MAC 1615]